MSTYFGIDLSPVGLESAVIDEENSDHPVVVDPGNKVAAVAFMDGSKSLQFGNPAEKRFKNSKSTQVTEEFFDNPLTDRGIEGYTSLDLSGKYIREYVERLENSIANKASSCVCALPSSWRADFVALWTELKSTISLGDVAVVDSGLLASSLAHEKPLPKSGPFFFVDITRQNASITTLEFNDSALQSVRTELIPEVGEAFFRNEIFKCFVEALKTATGKVPVQNRSDAQILYDQIDPCLKLIASEGVAKVVIDNLQADISRDLLALQLKRVWKPLIQKANARANALGEKTKPFFKVSSRVSIIPGFVQELENIKNSVVECLPPFHLAIAASYFARDKELIKGGGDELIVSIEQHSLLGYDEVTPFGFKVSDGFVKKKPVLPVLDVTDQPTVFRTGENGFLRSKESPTHLLFQGRMLPLSGESFYVGSDLGKKRNGLQIVEDIPNLKKYHFMLEPESDGWSIVPQGGVLVNRKEICDLKAIYAGDIIEIKDTGLLLMAVKSVSAQLV